MATYRKKGKSWVAEVARRGFRKSKSFPTKREAVYWATMLEEEILAGKINVIPDLPVSRALERYRDEVSPKKRGARWEIFRLNKISLYIGHIGLRELRSHHIAAWRDKRLTEVSASSVSREMNLVSHVCTICIKEWGWLESNPCSGVARPPRTPHRERRISEREIQTILHVLGYEKESPVKTKSSRAGAVFAFAIETAMRLGEITSLTWSNVDFKNRVATLPLTKNGYKREVPLSSEAIRIIRQMPVASELVFNISKSSVDSLFRKAREKALLEDLHFHDTRHEAITRLARKLHILDLARMVGHRDLKMLQIYYNASAADIAKKLK